MIEQPKEVFIRDVEPSDLSTILNWENDPVNWSVSETKKEYSKEEIKALVASSQNFDDTRQKRWIITLEDNSPLGTVDIFQGSFPEGEVGIGILIADESNRRKGYAKQAIYKAMMKSIIQYSQHTFYADIHADNSASKALFEKCEFETTSEYDKNPNFNSSCTSIIRMKLCVKK